jgi:hypothetical protein
MRAKSEDSTLPVLANSSPPGACNPDSRARYVQAKPYHLFAYPVERSRLLVRKTAARNKERRFIGDQESTGKPVCFLFQLPIPVTAPTTIESGAGRVEEKAMRELVCEIAGLSTTAMSVIVDNDAPWTVEYGNRRESCAVDTGKVSDYPFRVRRKGTERNYRNRKMLG